MIVNYNSLNRSRNARLGKNVEESSGAPPGLLSTGTMRSWFMNLMIAFCLFFGGSLFAQVSVTATAGTAGPTSYATLNAAFAAINGGTHQGAITVSITANTSEPAAAVPLLGSGGTSSYTSIVIRPSGGNFTVASAAAPTASRGVIELNGADNVTIDGDDPATSGTRNLTFAVAQVTSAGVAALRVSSASASDGATNISIKNCVIQGSRSSETSTVANYGIYSGTAGTGSTSTSGQSDNVDNLTIENNLITRSFYGIYVAGTSTNYADNLIVKNNVVGSNAVSADRVVRGMYLQNTQAVSVATASAAIIEGNDVQVGHSNGNASYSAIEVANGNAGMNLRRNYIHDCVNPGSGVWGMYGINITGSGNNAGINIFSNIFRDITGYSTSSAGNQYSGCGLYVAVAATGINVVNNTFLQNGNTPAQCILATSGTFAKFMNNILVNRSTSNLAHTFYVSTTTTISAATVNNNNYFTGTGSHVGYYSGANRTTLAAWQTATSKDANSLSVNPPFTSTTDVHIPAGTQTLLESAGASVATSGVNFDFDGQVRPGPVGSVNGGATAPDMGADEFDGVVFNCPQTPAALTTSALTTTTATISWTAASPVPGLGYDYEVRTSGAVGSGSTGLVANGTTTSLSVNLSALAANTVHTFYVRSRCTASDQSSWVSSTFYTGHCLASGLTSSTTYSLTNATVTGYNSTLNNTSTQGAGGYSDFTAQSASGYAGSSASVSLTAAGGTVYFYVWVDWNNDLDFADANETLVATTSYASSYSGSVTVPAGTAVGSYRMRIAINGSGAITSCGVAPYGEYEDYTFNVVAPPACLPITGLTASAVSFTSGTFSWTAPTPAPSNGYEYEVRTSGAAGSGSIGLQAQGSTAAGVTTANVSALTANTTYTVYVRSNCAGSGNSTWSSGVTFYTGYCVPTGGTSYYLTNFSMTNAVSNINNTSTAGTGGYTNFTSVSGTSYPGQVVSFAMTPSSGTNYYFIWVDWNNDLDFADANETVLSSTTTYLASYSGTYTIPAGVTPGTYRLRAANSWSGVVTSCGPGSSSEYEDYTLTIVATPTCFPPASASVSALTHNSAVLSWPAATPAPGNGYEYYVSTSSTAPTTATTPTGAVGAGVLTTNLSLSADTQYYAWVRSVCSGSDTSYWTATALSFRSYCTPVAAFSENFDAVTAPALPSCWTGLVRGTQVDTPYVRTSTTNFSAPNSVYLYNAGSTATELILVSPYLSNLGAGTHQLRLYARNGTASQDIIVGTLNSNAADAVFTPLQTVDINTTFAEYVVSFASYTGTDKFIGIKRLNTSTYTSVYVDNLNWEVIPTCFVPTAVTATTPTVNGITLNWTAPTQGTPVSYEYEVRTSGAAGSGNTGLAATGTVPAGTTTVTLSTLSASGMYTVYMRTNCGGTDHSIWTLPVYFNTLCGGAISALPWTENFDSMPTLGSNVLVPCWSQQTGSSTWTSANAAGNTYNDPRSTPNYMTIYYGATPDYLWSPGIQMTEGNSYDFSFYWVGDGTAGWNAEVLANATASSTGATTLGAPFIAPATTTSGTVYTQVTRTFTAPSTGIYYFGIKAFTSTTSPWYLGFDDFRIQLSPTSVTSFTPLAVCQGGGTTVTISGTSFTGATAVSFNGIPAQSFTVTNGSTISAVSPAGVTAGPITVTAPLGTAASSSNYTVTPMPVVGPITGTPAALCIDGTADLDNATPGGTWSSSDISIASVDALGVVTAHAGGTVQISYTVTDLGCSTSSTTSIVVNETIVSSNPVSQTVVTGDPASFSVTASGSIVSYQWMVSTDGGDVFEPVVDDAVYSGATTNSLSITDTPEILNGNLYMVVITATAPCDDFNSDPAVLNVGDTGIETDPASVTICSSGTGTASFTVVASGTVDTYAWEENQGLGFAPITDGTFGGVTYSGSTTDTLTISGLTVANSGWNYQAVVTGPANGATSNPATLTINEGVSIQTQPASASNCYSSGSSVFSVVANGAVNNYQWQYSTDGVTFNNVANGTPVGATYTNANTASMTVATTAATPASGTYYYHVVVGGVSPCGSVTSQSAQLSIFTPAITAAPAAASVGAGSSTTMSVATSAPGATYQWQYATTLNGTYNNVADGTPAGLTYLNATSDVLTINASASAAASTARFYRVIVTANGCSVTTAGAQLTVLNYCIPAATSTVTYISNFATAGGVTNISNNSGTTISTGGYGNFTNLSASQYQGQPLNFSSTTGAGVGMAIWVDFNNNFTFETGERVYNTTAYGSNASGSFTIPLATPAGSYRMRVLIDWNSNNPTNSCGFVSGRGEAEDYTLTVLTLPTCSGTPTAGTVTASTSTLCLSGTSTLTVSGYTNPAIGISLQWYDANGPIAGAQSASYTTPTITATSSYFVRVTCASSGLFADSNTVTVNVSNPSVTGTTPASRCGIGTVTLGATGSAGTQLTWFAAATGGVPLGTGNTFTTPSISTTTNYYVSAGLGGSQTSVGLANNVTTTSNNGYSDVGLMFNATTAFTLNSVAMYPIGTAGNNASITIQLKNSAGTVLQATTVSVPMASTPVKNIVPLNFSVPAGTDYRLVVSAASGTGLSGLVREITSGFAYPYTAAGVASITSAYTSGASSSYYYYFYDWSISTGCSSARTLVTATVSTPPALTLSSASTTICAGTPSAPVTLTSNVASYDTYVWTPSTGVTGNATSGFIFNPATTTAYTLTASQTGGSQCVNVASFTANVNPAPTSFTITPATATVCVGDAATALTAPAQAGSVTLGTGTTLNTSSTTAAAYPTPYGAFYENAKQQYLIRASELTALGLQAGSPISSLSFNVSNLNASGLHTAYTISVGNTAQNAIATWETGLTTVFGPVNYQPVAGVNTHTFSTPFVWNGTSNIVVQICHTNDTSDPDTDNYSANAFVAYATTTFNSSLTYRVDDADACGSNLISYTEAQRPNMTFGVAEGPVWTPATGLYTDATATTPYVVGTRATVVYAKPTATSTYTATATNSSGCSKSATATITVNQYYDFYVDADGDHYGTGAPVSFCAASATAAPAGYASVAGDCNDNIAAINPGHAEVPYNGVDDNCNGTIDEGSQLFSQIIASQCGTTLASISSVIGAVNYVAPVDGYRFEVTNTTTNAVQTIDRNVPNFQLSLLPVYDYATTYSIRVMLRRNGIWLNYYGPSCLISTPAILDQGGAAAVNPSQCGIVLPSISTLIATTSLPGVTAYRFRVTNLTDSTAPFVQQTIDRNYHWFSLTMLTRFNYGTEYQIEVAVKTANGAWSGFGAPCNVTSPAVPTLSNCGAVIAGSGTHVSATSLNRAQAYRFEITNMSTFEQTIVDRSQNWFTFTNVPNYTPGGVYAVRIAVQTSGYWSPYGEACEITAPGAARSIVKDEEAQPMVDFRAVAYPNPYVESFAINMETSSEEAVSVKVYDMVGKLLEDREFPIDRVEMQQFGERYPSGVYNIVVTQGGFVKTLRVIKR